MSELGVKSKGAGMECDAIVAKLEASPETAFGNAGFLLAEALLCDDANGKWATETLATTMVAILERATLSIDTPEERVRAAAAAAILSIARPSLQNLCDEAIAIWMGPGIGTPRRMLDPRALARRVLLGLATDDLEDAAQSVDALGYIDGPSGMVGGLYDWVVARIQHHGHGRENQCFDHLRICLGDMRGTEPKDAITLLLGAVVLASHGGVSHAEALRLLDGLPLDRGARGAAGLRSVRPAAVGTLSPVSRRASLRSAS